MKLSHLWRGLAATVLSLSVLSAHADVKENTVRVGYQKYGTLIILKAKGQLEQRLEPLGFKVEWVEFPAGPQMLEGLNVGSIDLATTGETPPVFAQAANADLLYIAHEPPAPLGEAIVVHKDSPIKSVADLKGKKVALNKGSNVHYLLVKALEEAGLGIRDVQSVYLQPSDARAAFDRGSVDAWVIWDPFLAAVEHASQARVLRDGTGLVHNHQFYLASRAFATRYPDIVKLVVDEINAIDQWGKANPDAVTAALTPVLGLPEPAVRKAVERYSYGAKLLTPEVASAQQQIADVFYELKLIPKGIQIGSVVWNPVTVSKN